MSSEWEEDALGAVGLVRLIGRMRQRRLRLGEADEAEEGEDDLPERRGFARLVARMRQRRRERLGDIEGGALELAGLTPTLPKLTLQETEAMLQGLYAVNLTQLSRGTPGIDTALQGGKIKYIRSDAEELWQPIRTIWENGGGDCEDLAAAVAAELTRRGIQAVPTIYRVRPGLAHAVVRLVDPRWQRYPVGSMLFGHPVIAPGLLDPSRTGGMGRP